METNNSTNSNQRDENLWKLAKRRAEFKKHLLVYILVNLFLWVVWLFSSLKTGRFDFPWPAFATFGWGIGLAFNYIGAYTGNKDTLTEKEYKKLIDKQN